MMTQRWVKEGSYPEISPVRSDWRKISAIGAVALWLDDEESLQTKVFFRLHPDENITSNLIRDFLHQVRLQVDGQMTVLWDRVSVHTANRIERFFERYDRPDKIRIPTACPELNPCEEVLGLVETHRHGERDAADIRRSDFSDTVITHEASVSRSYSPMVPSSDRNQFIELIVPECIGQ